MDRTKSIWNMNAESAKNRPPGLFPVELPYRLIQLYPFTNDIVLDPLCGQWNHGSSRFTINQTGTTLDKEINEEYVKLAEDRVFALLKPAAVAI